MISLAVPVIIILIGFALIGSTYSTFGGAEGGITFDPIGYLSRRGKEWSIVVVLISLFEIFWWKDRNKQDK